MTGESLAVARLCRATASVAAAFALVWVAVSGLGIASAAAAECPNEALRSGPSAALPGCRAYEMVSPVEKNGGSVSFPFAVHVATQGGAASFFSSGAFAGAQSSALANSYISRRGANWATEALTTPQFNKEDIVTATTKASSPDLSESLAASQLALTPGAIEGGSNLYLRDDATGSLGLVAATPGRHLFQFAAQQSDGTYQGGTQNWSQFIFFSPEALPPGPGEPKGAELEGPGLAIQNVYEFRGGRARIVDVLPDGTTPPEGVRIPGTGAVPTPNRHLMSDDGSKVFFEVGLFGGPIYVRENGATTKPVSISHKGAEAGEVEPAEFGVASADGSVAYFTSNSELLEGSNNEGSTQLYRYETATGTTTELIPEPPPGGPQISRILGASEDGSFVYFVSPAVLAEGVPTEGSGGNIYVWHDNTIKFVAQLTEGVESSFPHQWAISPDGRHFAFGSYSPIDKDDVSSTHCPASLSAGNAEGHCLDVYAFDFESGAQSCISCAGNAPAIGDSSVGGQENHESGIGDEFPHSVLNDGTIFMDTPNRLLPRDSNGVLDVYAWRDGSYELISTGSNSQPSTFGNATPSGSEIYLRTSQQLVAQDTDSSVDLYDDREGGGLASQGPPETPPALCEAEGCRGPSPTAPAGLASGSRVAAATVCGDERAAARTARQHANSLASRARKAAKGKGKAAKAKARGLRRQASAARKRANRLQNKAKECGGSK